MYLMLFAFGLSLLFLIQLFNLPFSKKIPVVRVVRIAFNGIPFAGKICITVVLRKAQDL